MADDTDTMAIRSMSAGSISPREPTADPSPRWQFWAVGSVVGLGVLLAAWIGIAGRAADLALFWPANALLAGIMVRWRHLNRTSGWVGACVGYLIADLSTGSDVVTTLGLTAANVAGVIACVALIGRWSMNERRLQAPRAVLRLVLVCVLAGLAATAVGAPFGVVSFGMEPVAAVQVWFAAELAGYLALLPVVLTFPGVRALRAARRASAAQALHALAPVGVVAVASVGGMVLGGGAGAVMFSLPVLLWTALRGEMFLTAVLILGVNVWNLIALSEGWLSVDIQSLAATEQIALQMVLVLVGVGPLMVAASTFASEELLRTIREQAEIDQLTGVRNRGGFLQAAERSLAEAEARGLRVAVLMVDLDRFKSINDNHGHAVGDEMLRQTGAVLRRISRRADVVGRLGGEEFAVVAVGLSVSDAVGLAERMRAAIGEVLVDGEHRITASVGVAGAPGGTADLHELLRRADQHLYRAKRTGRDRVFS